MPTVAITGLSAKSNYGSLRIFSSDWYSFYFEQQNILDGYGSANKTIDGETATVSNNALIALGDANCQQSGITITTSISDVLLLADSLIEITGFGSVIDYGTVVVTGTEDVSVIIGGISLISEFESVIATAIDAINVEIAINGLSVDSSIGSVLAKIENPEIWSTGKIQRYPANAFKNSKVKLLGIEAIFAQNAIVAVGTSEINATIMLDNVVSFTQIANINADGVLSINDEELILLMAA